MSHTSARVLIVAEKIYKCVRLFFFFETIDTKGVCRKHLSFQCWKKQDASGSGAPTDSFDARKGRNRWRGTCVGLTVKKSKLKDQVSHVKLALGFEEDKRKTRA